MIFNHGYYHPMDREYLATNEISESAEAKVERPVSTTDIGQTVTEGNRFGPFRQSVNAAIRAGATQVELQTQMGGGAEPVGAEAYGKQARQELREIAEANKIQFTSVHAPTQIGNLSGFQPRQGGPGDFSDEYRKTAIEEIRKAVDFAADVSRGGAVVIHTGEWQRPMTDMWWNQRKDGTYEFLSYNEEPGRGVTFMVDDRTGRVIGDVRKSQTVREPIYRRAGITTEDYKKDVNMVGQRVIGRDGKWHILQKGDLLDKDGKYINPDNPDELFFRVPAWNAEHTRFDSVELTWDDFVQRAKDYNERNQERIARGIDRPRTPEDMFFKTQLETQILQYRGSSLYHGRFYEGHLEAWKALKKAEDFYNKLEKSLPEEEKWKLMTQKLPSGHYIDQRYIPPKNIPISEYLKDLIKKTEDEMKYIREASAAADSQADAQLDTLKHVVPVGAYGREQSLKSYAELGIYAMQQSEASPHANRDIFLAPENIFPEMGYGSHPEEMIDLVQSARGKMVQYLTEKYVPDPYGRKYTLEDAKNLGNPDLAGKPKMVTNPYYHRGMSREQAEKEACDHIKATLDTQHLGMWRKHFQPQYNKDKGRMETKEELDERFRKWYLDEVKRMHEAGVIGNIHVVDGLGGGHHHLPAGQGDLPIVEAVEWLKKRGYDKALVSEAHGEEAMQQGRILTETWKAFGSSVYGAYGPAGGWTAGAPMNRWEDIHQSYFGRNRPPYYIFGNYAPSNDWTLWTQVPLE